MKFTIKFISIISAFLLFFSSCSTTLTGKKIHEKSHENKKIRFLFQTGTNPTLLNSIVIATAQKLPPGFSIVDKGEDITIYYSEDLIESDYTISYFVLPILLSYLGSPIGTITKNISIRVVEQKSKKILSVWHGKFRKTLFLYYLPSAAKEDINKLVIQHIVKNRAEILQL